jgi:triacylglycerol lipase
MKRFIIPLALVALALPTVAAAELPKDTQEAIVKMGHVNDPKTASLFVSMHKGVPANIEVSRDLPFGSDPAQKLDLFTSGQGAGKPILIYVHGGGFTRGDKHRPGEFMYDNVMVWAVQHGMVAAETNYRLATPQTQYPAANDDVSAAVKYVRDHARAYGGDPNKIVVWGHSAGAASAHGFPSRIHQSLGGTSLARSSPPGGYEFKAESYLGDDPAKLAERSRGRLEDQYSAFSSRRRMGSRQMAGRRSRSSPMRGHFMSSTHDGPQSHAACSVGTPRRAHRSHAALDSEGHVELESRFGAVTGSHAIECARAGMTPRPLFWSGEHGRPAKRWVQARAARAPDRACQVAARFDRIGSTRSRHLRRP